MEELKNRIRRTTARRAKNGCNWPDSNAKKDAGYQTHPKPTRANAALSFDAASDFLFTL